jgi:16S rRNA (uracil1498-N3)-methyltransferase
MEHPFFYEPSLPGGQEPFHLSEDSSRHIVTVLRMRNGERLLLTDGKGRLAEVEILDADKKKTQVKFSLPSAARNTAGNSGTPEVLRPGTPGLQLRDTELILAVSLLKNTARFEWILEKATEIGVTAIIPLICRRTERVSFRQDRLQQIVISAMLQSRQAWLPELREPTPLEKFLAEHVNGRSYIAHCLPEERQNLHAHPAGQAARVLIGPEGDFTPDEIKLSLDAGFLPVTLGQTRLRTETAAVVAAALLKDAISR